MVQMGSELPISTELEGLAEVEAVAVGPFAAWRRGIAERTSLPLAVKVTAVFAAIPQIKSVDFASPTFVDGGPHGRRLRSVTTASTWLV
jgi:hypothetical protein